MSNINSMIISGNTGEACVRNILFQMDVKFFHNVYFENKAGDIAQVDFLVVTDRCLICIEVKTYTKCVIKGSEFNKGWTVCYLNKNKSLYNPILQNSVHIKIVLECLGFSNLPIYNYVVFPNACSLAIDKISDEMVKVITMSELWYEIIKDSDSGRKLKREVVGSVLDTITAYDKRIVELSEKHCQKYFSSGGI